MNSYLYLSIWHAWWQLFVIDCHGVSFVQQSALKMKFQIKSRQKQQSQFIGQKLSDWKYTDANE